MKRIFIISALILISMFLIIVLLFNKETESDEIKTDNIPKVFSPKVEKEIKSFITKFKINDSDVFVDVYLYQLNNEFFLAIEESLMYDKESIKGYTFIDSTLIVYYRSDSVCNKQFVNESNLLKFIDTIPGYFSNEYTLQIRLDPSARIYKIISKDSLQLVDEIIY